MTENSDQQIDNRRNETDWVISPPDEVHPLLGGEVIGIMSELLYAPSPEEIREMLIALRRRQKWSQTFTAAVLGVTEGAVVKWEAGKRKPNGAAAKLIFLLYCQIIEKADKVKNCWDLAVWGRVPCRNSMQLIALGGTFWVPDTVFREISATPSDRLRPELKEILGTVAPLMQP